MDIRREVDNQYCFRTNEDYINYVKRNIDEDTRNKTRAILDILRVGTTSIAQAELILHLCEDNIKRCTLIEGTKRDY